MTAWDDGSRPDMPRISVIGWGLVGLRILLILLVLLVGLPLLLILRVPERIFYGQRRKISPIVTQFVCKIICYIIGLKRRIHGKSNLSKGAFVANHATWLDIFVLNASTRIMFISKDDVKGWPGIGVLAQVTGTMFIRRDRAEAATQQKELTDRLILGHRFLFFPEGTSTDGQRVLPFKTMLFNAFFADDVRPHVAIQPISVRYHAPKGHEPRFYGWWGNMDFAAGLIKVLSQTRHGHVDVVFHPPLNVSDFANRKELAKAAEAAVTSGFTQSAPAER